MKYLIVFLILISACSQERKLQRFCRQHPEYCTKRVDTIFVDIPVTIDSVKMDSLAKVVLDSIEPFISPDAPKQKLKRQIAKVLKTGCPDVVKIDTTYFYSKDGKAAKIWSENGKLKGVLYSRHTTVAEPKKEFRLGFGAWLAIVLTIVLLLIILIRK